MSDAPQGPGWWQASDDRWYPPETHPDYIQPPPAPLADMSPPSFDQRVPTPHLPPPGQPAPGPGTRYPAAPVKKRSTGKVLAIVFGLLFLLIGGGCGVFLYSYRDEIADAGIDFSDAVPAEAVASCEVVGVGFGENYDIDVTLEATDISVDSHYKVTFEAVSASGASIGEGETVLRSMTPDELRTEDTFNTIFATDDYETVDCRIVDMQRVDA